MKARWHRWPWIRWIAQRYISPIPNAQLRKLLPAAVWEGRHDRPEIALTFDDGPHSAHTSPLLHVLEQHEVQATFFHLGLRVKMHWELMLTIAEAGHQIGIHGYSHRSFALLPNAILRSELQHSRSLIAAASGLRPDVVRAVRPPYGILLPSQLELLAEWGYVPVMWGLAPLHWLQDAAATEQQVMENVQNGTLLVFHEGLGGPSPADLMRTIIPRLRAAGYQFVTVAQLCQMPEKTGFQIAAGLDR